MACAYDFFPINHRLTAIVGHYGSGKTELAVNLAFQMADMGRPTTLADLDIVNPYFRSRERKEQLEARGVRLIATSQACINADVPALPAALNALLQTEQRYGILDIGGNGAGARVLARYQRELSNQEVQVLMVVNRNRPQTATVQQVIACLEDVESVSGLQVTGLVNNTHLCGETRPEDIRSGAALVEQVSARTGIPVAGHMVVRSLLDQVSLDGPVIAADIYMKKPWERA